MTVTEEFADALVKGATELRASKAALSHGTLFKLRRAIEMLQETVDKAERFEAARLVVHEDGSVGIDAEKSLEPALTLTEDGVEVC